MGRLRAGDQDAACEVHDRWARRLIGLARAKLGPAVAAREDPEDVVQSTYRSFFRRYGDGAYSVEDWDDVWALLATIAARKCSNRRQFHRAGRRDWRREEPRPDGDGLAAGPSPEDAAVLIEVVEGLLRGIEAPERAIVQRSLQGESAREIALGLGRSERTVQRVRERVRLELRRGLDDAG